MYRRKFVITGLLLACLTASMMFYHKKDTPSSFLLTPSPSPLPLNDPNTLQAPSSPVHQNSSSRRLLCHTLYGRLGNQLFQYASVLGLAHRTGRTLAFVPGRRPFLLKHILERPPPILLNPLSPSSTDVAVRCQNSVPIRERKCCSFDERLMKLNPAKDYTVDRFLQSWKYFEEAEEQVREAMTIRKDVLQRAHEALQEELRKARAQGNNDNTPTTNNSNNTSTNNSNSTTTTTNTSTNNSNNNTANNSTTTSTNNSKNDSSATTLLIGVHVRRGDYLMGAKWGFILPPTEYYRRAMAYMRSRFANGNGKGKKGEKENSKNNVTFLVSVDDRKWFLEKVTSSNDVIVLNRRSPAVDMVLLSLLDHVIISAGTYSWWVGFLNKGVTVYWKDFVAPGTPLGDGYGRNGSTFVYPGWVPL